MRSGWWEEVKTPIFFTHQLPDASVSLLPDEDHFIYHLLYRGALKINEMFLNTLKAPGTVIVLSIRRCTWLALLAHTKIEGGEFKRRVGALKTHPRAVSRLAWVSDRSPDATGWEQGDDDVQGGNWPAAFPAGSARPGRLVRCELSREVEPIPERVTTRKFVEKCHPKLFQGLWFSNVRAN